ncbi:50S ribosomal protein L19e, partial [Methanocaldococcus villosus KIN24-T80]
KKGISNVRVKKLKEQKKKGRRRGPGSRRGAKGARTPQKERWMATIRALRKTLKHLRDEGKIDTKTYRKLYRMAKGGAFRSRAHLFLYMKEHEILK